MYVPNPTPEAFHADDESRIKILMSAVGCGKSAALVNELLFRACEQEPDAEGVRYTRFAIVRSSYGQLKSTTIKTFQDWVSPKICKIVYDSPIRGHIKGLSLGDGTTLDAEFVFMSLDSPDAIAQLLSLELTGAAVNEIAEIRNQNILKDLFQRCARYPSKKMGVNITWHGIIGDMNPPPQGSWLYDLFEKDRPPGHKLYRYPPPIHIHRDPYDPDNVDKINFEPNSAAENVQNLDKGYDYWIDIAKQNIHDWDYVTRFCLGDYPYGASGRPIYPVFSHARHVRDDLLPHPGSLLLIGMDFGFKPAAAFLQFRDGYVQCLDEICTEDASLDEFVEEMLLPKLRTEYPGYKAVICGDPSGDSQGSTIDRATSFRFLRQRGLKVYKPLTNKFKPRRDSVTDLLSRHGRFYVHPQCTTIIGGFMGGYRWKEQRGVANEHLRPDKSDIHSHVQDAIQAVALYLKSGGETYVPFQSHDEFDMRSLNQQSRNQRPKFLYA